MSTTETVEQRIRSNETQSQAHVSVSSSSSLTRTTGMKTIFGISDERLFTFAMSLRNPVGNWLLNSLVFLFFTLDQSVGILYSWVDHQTTMEGTYSIWLAKILSLVHTFGANFFGAELNAVLVTLLFLMEIITLALIFFGFSAQARGSFLIF